MLRIRISEARRHGDMFIISLNLRASVSQCLRVLKYLIKSVSVNHIKRQSDYP